MRIDAEIPVGREINTVQVRIRKHSVEQVAVGHGCFRKICLSEINTVEPAAVKRTLVHLLVVETCKIKQAIFKMNSKAKVMGFKKIDSNQLTICKSNILHFTLSDTRVTQITGGKQTVGEVYARDVREGAGSEFNRLIFRG